MNYLGQIFMDVIYVSIGVIIALPIGTWFMQKSYQEDKDARSKSREHPDQPS